MDDDSSPTHKSDIELATEIGRGLLCEINRMRALLQEKNEAMEAERSEYEQKMHELLGQLAHKREMEERYKEDIWNLETTKQNLTFQISQLKTTIQKLQAEHRAHQKQEIYMQNELEELKAAQKSLQTVAIRSQVKHESILAELNKETKRLKEEKQELLNRLHQQQQHLQKVQQQQQQEEENTINSDINHSSTSMSLVEAQSSGSNMMMKEIKNETEKEREKAIELDRLLRDAQDTIENMQQTNQGLPSATAAYSTCSENESSPTSHPQPRKTLADEMQRKEEEEDEIQKYLPSLSQTMIGERLKKHIRHPIKGKIKSIHTRYFWLHPYTKTLYWSVHKPEQGELPIQSYSIIQTTNQIPIIRIQSIQHQMKIQCMNHDSHQKWTQSLECLFMKSSYSKTMNRLSQLLEDDSDI
ncbi:hypothetical protein G6F46_001430 [Rhizopus delemar]|nr:hypothetical protein G6F54_002195 [Rhizopus delemar]KAG1518315.1 hypothetical protein G6F53_000686 [Rhizopus delemar]KAG1604491.1 hypothetical protein G6F47_000870 [Rhizopus delemar]KAG1621683.1 hypothetical protein G6F46_001430 [Rhizopus delemar]